MTLRNTKMALFYAHHLQITELQEIVRSSLITGDEKSDLQTLYMELDTELKKHPNKLFSEERVTILLTKILERDQGESGKQYRAILNDLKEMATNHKLSQQEVNQTVKKILLNFIYKGLKDHGIELKPGDIEICIPGSLASGQATPYSDIDCFIILSDNLKNSEKMTIKKVISDLVNAAYKIGYATNQFLFDPLLFNPAKLCGTVDELYESLVETDDESQFNGMSHAKSISQSSTMLENLRNLIADYTHQSIHRISNGKARQHSEHFFNESKLCLEKKYDHLNIKTNMIRPLQFVLYAMCMEAKIKLSEHDIHELPREGASLARKNLSKHTEDFGRHTLKYL